MLNKENLSWPQNFVQSYVTHKTGQFFSAFVLTSDDVELTCVRSHSAAGGEEATAEEEQRAEERVRSPGGGGQQTQQHHQGTSSVCQSVFGDSRSLCRVRTVLEKLEKSLNFKN